MERDKFLSMPGVVILMAIAALLLFMTAFEKEAIAAQTTEKVIKLTYGSFLPSTHAISVADQLWMDYVAQKTNGRVHIAPHYSATLLSYGNIYEELAKRGADFANLTLHFQPDQFPLYSAVYQFMHGCPSPESTLRIQKELWAKFPEFPKEVAGIKILTYQAIPFYNLVTVDKPVRTLDDLKGMTLQTNEFYLEPARKLGASPLVSKLGQSYTNLQKGIVKGMFCCWDVLTAFRIAEVVKYGTELNNAQPAQPWTAMNWDTWNSLPPDIQKVIEESATYWQKVVMEAWQGEQSKGVEFAKTKYGVEFFKISKADYQRFDAIQAAEAYKRAAELDKRGLPATAIYEETQRLIKKYYGN